MRRIRTTVFGVLASVSLLGVGGMGIVSAATAAPAAGVVAFVPHPTAVEY